MTETLSTPRPMENMTVMAGITDSLLGINITQSIEQNKVVESKILTLMYQILELYVSNFMAILGVITNGLSLVVFIKQGFKDSVNISLTTVVFWDLVKCTVGTIGRLHNPIRLVDPALARSWRSVHAAKLAFLQIAVNYVTYPLAAYISVERALCVSIPFKVKSLFTPKLTMAMMIILSVSVFGMFAATLFVFDIVYVFSPEDGQIVATYTYSAFYHAYGKSYMKFYNFIGILNPVLRLVIITVCTVIISYHLHRSSKFRSRSSARIDDNSPLLSARDRQVIKMLLVVITMFIVNLIPRIAHTIAKLIEPEYYLLKRYHRYFSVFVSLVYAFDFINSSANFFIFLTMSSNFKKTFVQMFLCCVPKSWIGNKGPESQCND